MAERQTVIERKTVLPLPHKTIITGVYREKGKLVVRKFEELGKIRIPLDEEYVLNEDDAEIVLNIMDHKTQKFRLN